MKTKSVTTHPGPPTSFGGFYFCFLLKITVSFVKKRLQLFLEINSSQRLPSSPSPMGEVAFSSRCGAWSGRPPQCGAAAADAAESPVSVDAGGDASKRPRSTGRTRQKRRDRSFTIKAPALPIGVGVFNLKGEIRNSIFCLRLTAGMQVERLGQDRSHLS